jgi:prepilin-type N-terminal cleavage/methylation domain-containing protein
MRRAFSLVEVLLAILILAIGLLGLGAIIPSVVKMQRTSTDQTLGVVVANSAKAQLLNHENFRPTSPASPVGWDFLLNDNAGWSSAGTNANDHLWYPWQTSGDNFLDLDTGVLTLGNQTLGISLGLNLRLWPDRSTQPVQISTSTRDPFRPQFVWDIVARRVQTGQGEPRQVQVALFVRRLDLNIRVPSIAATRQPVTLLDVLLGTNGVSNSDRCVPVAVISSANPTPTNRGNNGAGNRTYGNFLTLDAAFDANRRDHIELFSGPHSSSVTTDTLLALASQPNQKLVDNFGNVYTVLRVAEELETASSTTVIVSPPVPASVPDSFAANVPDVRRFRQVVFTPQIAAAVEVFTVTRPVQ